MESESRAGNSALESASSASESDGSHQEHQMDGEISIGRWGIAKRGPIPFELHSHHSVSLAECGPLTDRQVDGLY